MQSKNTTPLAGKQACRMMVASFLDENGIESADIRMNILDASLTIDDWLFIASSLWKLDREPNRDVAASMVAVLDRCTSPRLEDLLKLKKTKINNRVMGVVEHVWDFRMKAAIIQFETTGKWPD